MHPRDRRWLAAACVFLLFAGVVGIRALTEPKNDFRFSIIGDRTGTAMPEIYGRIWREIDLMHPDFAINVGDTIEGGKDDLAESQWRDLRPLWERYRRAVPIITVSIIRMRTSPCLTTQSAST